jgi:catalase
VPWAAEIADGLGIAAPRANGKNGPPPGALKGKRPLAASPAGTPKDSIKSRKAAILAEDGVDGAELAAVRSMLLEEGAVCHVIARKLGALTAADGSPIAVDCGHLTAASVLYDALSLPGGTASLERMAGLPFVEEFVKETFHHGKPIAASGEAVAYLVALGLSGAAGVVTAEGGATQDLAVGFVKTIAQHRFFDRPTRPGGGGRPL